MMRRGSDSASLKDYVKAALQQWSYTFPFLRDKVEISKGTKIIYSVDTDIVSLFTNPSKTAGPNIGRHYGRQYGYLQLFEDDRYEECIARGRVIADHILRNINNGAPLLIVPPLSQEIVALHEFVLREVNQDAFQANEQLRSFVKELESIHAPSKRKELFDLLSEKAPNLIRLIEGEKDDLTTELRRFSILFRDHLVAGPEYFIDRKVFDPSVTAALQAERGSLEFEVELKAFCDVWANALKKKKEPWPKNLARDIQALGRIQLINQILPKDVKLIHVTGDRSIFDAAGNVFPSNLNGRSFADSYLRHPRAFFAEPGLLFYNRSTPDPIIRELDLRSFGELSEFSRWLIVFLAKFWKKDWREIYDDFVNNDSGHPELSQASNAAIVTFCKDFPNAVSDFRSGWNNFSGTVTLEHVRKMADSMPYLRDTTSYLRHSLSEIETLISDAVSDSWRASFESALATSYGITRIYDDKLKAHTGPARIVARSVPPVSLPEIKYAGQLIKEIVEARRLLDIREGAYAKLFDIVSKHEPSGYAYNLIYAVLFGAEGRWVLARILAERAFQLRETANNNVVTGREAAYFCAVAIRNSSKNANDVSLAERWLEVAQRIWDQDPRHVRLDICEIRFRVERASLKQSREFFHIFRNQQTKEKKNEERNTLRILQKEFEILFSENLELLDKHRTSDSYVHWINAVIERRLLINIFVLALVRQFLLEESFTIVEMETMRRLYRYLADDVAADHFPKLINSYLYKAVWIAATLWIGGKREELKKEAQDVLTDQLIDQYSAAGYDKNRLKFLRDVIEKIA